MESIRIIEEKLNFWYSPIREYARSVEEQTLEALKFFCDKFAWKIDESLMSERDVKKILLGDEIGEEKRVAADISFYYRLEFEYKKILTQIKVDIGICELEIKSLEAVIECFRNLYQIFGQAKQEPSTDDEQRRSLEDGMKDLISDIEGYKSTIKSKEEKIRTKKIGKQKLEEMLQSVRDKRQKAELIEALLKGQKKDEEEETGETARVEDEEQKRVAADISFYYGLDIIEYQELLIKINKKIRLSEYEIESCKSAIENLEKCYQDFAYVTSDSSLSDESIRQIEDLMNEIILEIELYKGKIKSNEEKIKSSKTRKMNLEAKLQSIRGKRQNKELIEALLKGQNTGQNKDGEAK